MNTKIVVQRLVNFVHSRAKASLALFEMDSGTLHSIKLGSLPQSCSPRHVSSR